MTTERRIHKRPRSLQKRRAILALDLDCFYASVAIRSRPHLADKPVVIVQKHLCVTSNYVARTRAKGAVQKMTPVSKALAACPDLVLIDGSDLTPFRAASMEVLGYIRSWLRQRVKQSVEKFAVSPFDCPCHRSGFDEVFIDVTELVDAEVLGGGKPWKFDGHIFGTSRDDDSNRTYMVASQIAQELRSYVIEKSGLTLCAGISESKLLSKLAVTMNKPNDQTTFLPDDASHYISTLHPRSLPGLGHGFDMKIKQWTSKTNNERPAETVRDLLAILGNYQQAVKLLTDITHSEGTARHIYSLCHGEDKSEVIDNGDAPKSISSEDSCRNCTTISAVHQRITRQATKLVQRLRGDGKLYSRFPRTFTVKYRKRGQGFVGTSRSVPMPSEIVSVCLSSHANAEEKAICALRRAALDVLKEHGNIEKSSSFEITLLAVGATNFTGEDNAERAAAGSTISSFFTQKRGEENDPNMCSLAKYSPPKKEKDFKQGVNSRSWAASRPKHLNLDSRANGSRCPMCEENISGGNIEINLHVDKCLGIRTKIGKRKKRRAGSETMSLDSFFRKA